MSQSITLVATVAALEAAGHSVTPQVSGKPGILSAEFAISPQDCATAFGRWLAERVPTTRRDDDLSTVMVYSSESDAELALREFADALRSRRLRDIDDIDRLAADMAAWSEKRRRIAGMYGESAFAPVAVSFAWPVLGSAAAGGITDPAEYFDLCARLIRRMRPSRVRLWDGSEPPASLNVCG